MIEVLVASTILIVIVMMLAMLFQQTSLSWRTGMRQADAYMQIRSGLGAIQRDAAAAVDERTIPLYYRNKLGGGSQNFNGSLAFYTLSGSGFYDGNNNDQFDNVDMPYRALTYVTYNKLGNRTETVLRSDGSQETRQSANVLDFVKKSSGWNKPVTTIKSFTPESGPSAQDLPLFVNIKLEVETRGNSLDIGAASAGPDKKWGTKDDIRTWVE